MDLDFMHPFGAQTETISDSMLHGLSYFIITLTRVTDVLNELYIRNVLGVETLRPASQRDSRLGGTPLHVVRILKLVTCVPMQVTSHT